ncbi:MAG: DUF512 domain-containing protein [Candidatus Latescibacteria bacterium]|nr:DUF512 domain-containing protein [Candidatus Latescibacterota bacterium]
MIKISAIETGSLGARSGLAVGDQIEAINGEPIADLIDFQVHGSEQFLNVDIKRQGEWFELDLERLSGESWGLQFEEMRLRRCNNKCVFCFIHQMPKGLRPSLYFEDDDYRLSFLHGSYVTLTNVKEKDIDRIIEQGLSPQFISVHATDPAVRQKMLGRKLPVDLMGRIDKLASHGIEMHAQVVLCPGWNDGPHLERTIADLRRYYPMLRSIALVPVGLTRFRDDLPQLQPMTPPLAKQYLQQVKNWGNQFQWELGERLVYAADEFFLLTGGRAPQAQYYDAFPQIENGIGMVRSFLDRWQAKWPEVAPQVNQFLRLGLITGKLASGFMGDIVGQLNQHPKLAVDLLPVDNNFFGTGITVTGLLTGVDIVAKLRGGDWDLVLLPPNCVNGEGLTLDDKTILQLQQEAGVPLGVGTYDLADCLEKIFAAHTPQRAGAGRQLSELGFYVGRNNRDSP